MDDHAVLRAGCGLFDRSERGKLALSGEQAGEFLDALLSNDIGGLAVGAGCYATLLTHKGRILTDVRVLRGADEYHLDTERIGLQALFDALHNFKIGYRATLHKRTLECGLLSLIGPATDALLDTAPGAVEHANCVARVGGVEVLLARTDTGVDLYCEAGALSAVRDELERRGAHVVGEPAVVCLRIERGRPRFGVDMDQSTMPQEAGIHLRAVSYSKGCYVGQETVARLYWRGKPNRHLRGLQLSGSASAGAPLRLGEAPVGELSSSAESPVLGPIALALVRREAAPGETLRVGEGALSATVTELPFTSQN